MEVSVIDELYMGCHNSCLFFIFRYDWQTGKFRSGNDEQFTGCGELSNQPCRHYGHVERSHGRYSGFPVFYCLLPGFFSHIRRILKPFPVS